MNTFFFKKLRLLNPCAMFCCKSNNCVQVMPDCLFSKSDKLPINIIEENKIIANRCSICLEENKISTKCIQCDQCKLCDSCSKKLTNCDTQTSCPCCKLQCKKCLNYQEHDVCDWMKSTSYIPHLKIDIKMPTVKVTNPEERERAFLDKWLCLTCNCNHHPQEGRYIKAMKFACKFITRMTFFMIGCWIIGLFLIILSGSMQSKQMLDVTTVLIQTAIGFGAIISVFYCGTRCCCHTELNPLDVLMS